MTNHDTFIDTVREILATRGMKAAEMIAKIESALPPPPRPTLANMTLDERKACQWMQCDVEGYDDPWLIINPIDDEDHAHVVKREGNTGIFETKYITPRPDRPRMKWDDNDQSTNQ